MAEPGHDRSWKEGRRGSSILRQRRRYLFLAVGIGIGTILGLLLAFVIDVQSRSSPPANHRAFLVAPYHAVRLSTGRVIVGRLNQLAAPFMVVSGAYTVQSDVNADSKEITWSVVARGEDGSQPGTVIVGAQQVVSVEAARPGSRLATLLDAVRTNK